MSQQNRSTVRAVFADLFVALAAITLLPATPGNAAPAATDTCLAAPDSTPPEGSHWYFRTDRTTQRKCWYLAAQGQKAHRIVRRTAAVDEAATRPARSERKSEQSAAPTQPQPAAGNTQDRMQRFIYGAAAAAEPIAQAAPQPAAATATPSAGVLPWPAPAPEQPTATTNGAETAADMPVAVVSQAAVNDVQASEPRDDAPAARRATAAQAADDSAAATPLQMLLLFIAALALAGSLLHTVVKLALARRRRVYVDRREGTWSMSQAHGRAQPAYSESYSDDFDAPPIMADLYEDARRTVDSESDRLRQLLQSIDRRATAA
jgi:hypothetical protein